MLPCPLRREYNLVESRRAMRPRGALLLVPLLTSIHVFPLHFPSLDALQTLIVPPPVIPVVYKGPCIIYQLDESEIIKDLRKATPF